MRSAVASAIGYEKVNTIAAEDLSCQDTRTMVVTIVIQPSIEESAKMKALEKKLCGLGQIG
jgi:hypothetical protein